MFSVVLAFCLAFGAHALVTHGPRFVAQALPFQSQPIEQHEVPQVSSGVAVVKIDKSVDGDSSKQFIKDLKEANAKKPVAIVVEMETYGGEVDAGRRMAKAIEESGAPVTCVVDTEAESMGFYILQSCPTRLMTKRARLMVHEPSLSQNISGKSGDYAKVSRQLDSLNRAMCEQEAGRMTVSPDELRRRIRGTEWYMNWEDALKFKAVDGVVGSTHAVVEALRAGKSPL
jgi:membrane-bound serine protease (ClpP class)